MILTKLYRWIIIVIAHDKDRVMGNSLGGGYVSREYDSPTIEEVFSKLGLTKKNSFSREGILLFHGRTLRLLYNATLYAYATLNLVMDYFPKEDSQHFQPVLEGLSSVLKDSYENIIYGLGDAQELGVKISKATAFVSRAGNIFNNCFCRLPEKMQNAVLGARNMCDEAIRQPHFSVPLYKDP